MRIFDVINLIENGVHLDEYRAQESNWEIRNYHKLDGILVKLCELVVKGQQQDPNTHGMVAAAILDPNNRLVSSTGMKIRGKWHHAERCAMMKYEQLHGDIPNGSICITTCSPCSERMSDRYLESCTDLINHSNIHKVYAGYDDPTQPEEQRNFNIIETSNPSIRDFCHKLAETFMDWEAKQASGSLDETWSKSKAEESVAKNFADSNAKITLYTDTNYYGAEVDNLDEGRAQEIVHNNPSIATLKALARNNKYHSARFVIYKDGSVAAADSEHFTHQSMAPEMGAWDVRGYVQYFGDNDYGYRSMELYSGLTKDHPIFRNWEKLGIENGNPEVVEENFADGKGPGRSGDSARHGIPRHATLAQLDDIGNGSGRAAQLARWQANMRRGKKK